MAVVGLAAIMALLVFGVQRKPAPFDFLAGESYGGTSIVQGSAAQLYVCDPSPKAMIEKAKKELAIEGWGFKSESNGHLVFTSKTGAEIQFSISNGASFIAWPDLHRKTVVVFYRQPKTIDRIRAWLDRLMSRPMTHPRL